MCDRVRTAVSQKDNMKKENNRLSTRVSNKCSEDIDKAIEDGFAMNRSDFVRDALREHIRRCSKEKVEQ